MTAIMTVYESEGSRSRYPGEAERFDESCRRLESAGIAVERILCSCEEDIPPGEAADVVLQDGLDALPIGVYDEVVVSVGEYPSDQDLADFLDVPDGVLSVDRSKPPSMSNDLPPACACGNRTRRSRDRPGKNH